VVEGFRGHRRREWSVPVLNAVSEIDEIEVMLLRALASPHRLRIVHLLGARPREVRELVGDLDLGQATVSQHLAALRAVGLVEAVRDGRLVRYRLTDPQILEACSLMREVIVRHLAALGSLAAAASRDDAARRPGSSVPAGAAGAR
jgi:DNA-binding transcriptional ArsR family regulator